MRSRTEDGPLRGGTANHGRVIRVGDTVQRPSGPYTPAVHALLAHLRASGFEAVPEVRGMDSRTEVLGYIHGTSATEPLAAWALTDSALHSVGRLLYEYHRHAAGFTGTGRVWQRAVPDRWRGPLVTHNDLNPANVIFRDGTAIALIDFDLAAPGTAAWDLAVTACFWSPLRAEVDIHDPRRGERLRRFRVLLDGYGADAALRHEVVEACDDANRWIAAVIHDASRNGHPAFGRVWAAQADMYSRADGWLASHRAQLEDAAL